MADVRLVFDKPTENQLKHIYKAEEELEKAGVTFDTGSDCDAGKILSRDWELDWSLKGARIVEALGISKDEARAVLAALDWCEGSFKLGKRQESVRVKLHKLYPSLPNIYKHRKEGVPV